MLYATKSDSNITLNHNSSSKYKYTNIKYFIIKYLITDHIVDPFNMF